MGELDVRLFGAVGDGIHDDTKAIQAAIDEGADKGIAVKFPAGLYSVGELFVRKGSVLLADPTWGYREHGKTQLVQRYEEQRCVLNITDAFCCTINGLALNGKDMPGGCCGILARKQKQAHMEDSYRLERVQSHSFSGDACRLEYSWAFTVRHCMFASCGGDGLHLQNTVDGFILDTWFSGNRGCGYGTSGENNAITMSGCRVEWNAGGGIVIRGGSHYQLTGNYIDRSGKQGIYITSGNDKNGVTYSNTITCTGNLIYRSGKMSGTLEKPTKDRRFSSHIAIEKAAGVTIMGNTLCVGRDDNGAGSMSPQVGIWVQGSRYAVVSGNTLFSGALEDLVIDEGNKDVVIENNPGTLFHTGLASVTHLLPSTAAVNELFDQ